MTKVKCVNDDCYWCSKFGNCIKNEITINIDVACECYEPQEKEDTDEN